MKATNETDMKTTEATLFKLNYTKLNGKTRDYFVVASTKLFTNKNEVVGFTSLANREGLPLGYRRFLWEGVNSLVAV